MIWPLLASPVHSSLQTAHPAAWWPRNMRGMCICCSQAAPASLSFLPAARLSLLALLQAWVRWKHPAGVCVHLTPRAVHRVHSKLTHTVLFFKLYAWMLGVGGSGGSVGEKRSICNTFNNKYLFKKGMSAVSAYLSLSYPLCLYPINIKT